jgi:hypothetical protein
LNITHLHYLLAAYLEYLHISVVSFNRIFGTSPHICRFSYLYIWNISTYL